MRRSTNHKNRHSSACDVEATEAAIITHRLFGGSLSTAASEDHDAIHVVPFEASQW